jgi:hypothetical protein
MLAQFVLSTMPNEAAANTESTGGTRHVCACVLERQPSQSLKKKAKSTNLWLPYHGVWSCG